MRPGLDETLVRVREVLADVVLPDLRSDYARTQLQFLLMALDDVRKLDDFYPRALEENDDLEALFTDALTAGLPAEIAATLERALRQTRSAARYPSFIEVEGRNRQLREALARLIRLLDDGERSDRAVAVRRDLQKRIRAHLRKYVDRDAAMGVMVADRRAPDDASGSPRPGEPD